MYVCLCRNRLSLSYNCTYTNMNRTLTTWFGNCYYTFYLSSITHSHSLHLSSFLVQCTYTTSYWSCNRSCSSSSLITIVNTTPYIPFLWEVWSSTVHYEAFKLFLNIYSYSSFHRLQVDCFGLVAILSLRKLIGLIFAYCVYLHSFSLFFFSFFFFFFIFSMATHLRVCMWCMEMSETSSDLI